MPKEISVEIKVIVSEVSIAALEKLSNIAKEEQWIVTVVESMDSSVLLVTS